VFGPMPECSQAKLSVGVQGRFFKNDFLGMEELANERVVESGLPFLDDGHF